MKVKDLDEVMQDYAVRLRKRRSELKLTQEQAAHQLGVTLGAYNRWEAGTRLPDGRNAVIIEQMWGVGLMGRLLETGIFSEMAEAV
jgi:transcriptional regulator with XRE-family HTH domain